MHRLSVSARTGALSAGRCIELLCLIATIPAFYLALLSTHRPVSIALYVLAGAASALLTCDEIRSARRHSRHNALCAGHRLGLLLTVGLLLSAVVPEGGRLDVLGVRLATAALVVLRIGESLRPWFRRGGLPYLLALAVGILGLCGLGFWWLEPRAHTFGDGLWLAFTTAATVGYGDIVPSTPASKIFSVFVVLLGFAVLSVVTAAIAAMWVQEEERRLEREMLRNLHTELQLVRDELAAMRREQAARHDEP